MLKKSFIVVLSLCSTVFVCMAGHLVYLYTHCHCIPTDFQHETILDRRIAFVPDEPLKVQVQKLLKQKFLFCGRGKQMTAYESEDHRYVLKFFNTRAYLRKEWFHDLKKIKRLCTLKWISSAYFKRNKRLERAFCCHDIAFRNLSEESGMVYAHLNLQSSIPQFVDLVDSDGRRYHVPLEKTPFILQKKVELCMSHFDELLSRHDMEGVKQGVEQLRRLFTQRASKGFTDRIQTLHNNYGFVDGKAVQIDVGRIRKDDEILSRQDQEVQRILSDIAKRYPKLAPFILTK